MKIQKRNGQLVEFCGDKIINAMSKAFDSLGHAVDREILDSMLKEVLVKIDDGCGDDSGNGSKLNQGERSVSVEEIQDCVERTLMENGYYQEAKNYIIYRQKRSEIRYIRSRICNFVYGSSESNTGPYQRLDDCILGIEAAFPVDRYSLSSLLAKAEGFTQPTMSAKEKLQALIRGASELTSPDFPKWEMIAGRLLKYSFTEDLAKIMAKRSIENFYEKIRFLTDKGLYGEYILSSYSKDEILEAEKLIDNERDNLFSYPGLDLLLKRYVIRTHQNEPVESPQEMFMGIALHLAMNEKTDRLGWVKRFYDMLSRMEVTMATPTLSNARKPLHQLSSCFIDSVPDSLNGIYRSLDNFAKVSKFGGGMGMYFGKVRATGSSIRGFEGAAGGVIRWLRLVNDTAVAVDQLGMRQGAVAVYLDAWHCDLPEFLQIRTNNGDERMKAHDIFPAVCYPDLFWKLAETNMDAPWHLMCPHEVLTVKGYALEDYFGDEWERKYKECIADPRIHKRTVSVKDIVRLVLRSAVETGTPFAFNRDTVNRMNPNKHCGIIYCSNLCTEIAQNTSSVESVSTEVVTKNGDTVVVSTTKPGDFVVCNLASLNLGRIPLDDSSALQQLLASVVRALDNVIDLNFYPLPYAQITNKKYRSIGLGVSGYHHMLAKCGIKWESEEHIDFIEKVFEDINYAAILADTELAAERGKYSCFEGSDWQSGEYFILREYTGPRWKDLSDKVASQGMRNAYLLAVAPTSSTSILVGTTAGIDPIMKRFYIEEKKGSMLPRVAPDLSSNTFWLYKNAHTIDQTWSIRACAARQRHIDQAQSMNLYITNDFTMRQVLNLYLDAWRFGIKTIYYVRSMALEVETCESCSS